MTRWGSMRTGLGNTVPVDFEVHPSHTNQIEWDLVGKTHNYLLQTEDVKGSDTSNPPKSCLPCHFTLAGGSFARGQLMVGAPCML